MLTFDAPIVLKAEADLQGKRKSPPRISAVAYTGGMMVVSEFGPIVIDLSGLSGLASFPLLAEHENSLDSVIGSATANVLDGHTLVIEGTLAPSSPKVPRILALATEAELQASIGAMAIEKQTIEAGKTVTVNGRTLKSSQRFTLITKSVLREVSIVAMGADKDTRVAITATRKTGVTMPLEGNHTEASPGADSSAERISAIFAAAKTPWGEVPRDMIEAAINSGEDPREARLRWGELMMLRKETPRTPPLGISPPPVIGGIPGDARIAALSASLLVRAGCEKAAVEAYGERLVEGSKSMHNAHLLDICRASLADTGIGAAMSKSELVRAALSNHTLQEALSNTAHRVLLDAYRQAPATWRSFASIKPTENFKENTGIRPSINGTLEQLPKGGDVHHGTLSEETYTWRIDTFAKMISLDRKDIINDNLGVFTDAAAALARMAARSLNDLVWETILNAGSHFSAGNKNLLEDAGPLSISAFSMAYRAMMAQRDADGNDLDLRPAVLVVPPSLADVAKQILTSESVVFLVNDAGAPTSVEQRGNANPHRNAVRLEVEPRLENDQKYGDKASDQNWYLFGSPQDLPLVVGFLNGQQTPTIEFFGFSAEPSRLAASWRVFQDHGVAMGDHRAAVKSETELS